MDGDKDKFLDQVQNDLKNISLESKKSKQLQSLREATEEAIVKVRSAAGTPDPGLYGVANQVLYPLVQGCESKDGKVVKLCLSLMQRLIINKVINFKGGKNITDTLWMLMEAGIEEVKILQTITLLLTSNFVVQHETLAKCLVICFRLNFTKDSSINKIAGATVRQLVPVVFERVISAPSSVTDCLREQPSPNFQALINQMLPKNTDPFVVDAYLMFQDIVLLISAEQPIWLSGIMEMTRSFGLELLESILKKFTSIFKEHDEFKLLLKERVCSLVIKLFSPNTKYRNTSMLSASSSNNGSGLQDKPYYPITSKLLRVVSILILEYHQLLTTETEIFLSLVMKFLDPDKASWQNNIALEVIHKITVDSDLLIFICDTFDTNDLSTKVFQDIINGLGSYVQNVMMQQSSEHSDSKAPGPVAYGSTHPQAGFYHRNVWKPLTMSFVGGQTKEIYLDTAGGDKSDVPVVSDGYGVTLAYTCLLDTVRSLSIIMNRMEKPETIPYMKQLVNSSWCGILAALSLLLDASIDDGSTENILKGMETYASICGKLNITKARDAYLASICKASLPPHYTLNVLKATPCTQTVSGPRNMGSGGGHGDSNYEAGVTAAASAGNESGGDIRHQVVAVGTPLPTASLPSSAHQGPVMLTAKNLQCMRSILSIAHCYGNMLEDSWHILLTTLQHLVWILGLKPVSGGLLSGSGSSSVSSNTHAAGNASSDNNSVITTAVMADLPVLSNMVTRLFESSGSLSENSVNHLIEALCKLSCESMDLATTNREPSLFAVAKLMETALVNLYRLDMVWRSITSHLLLVCQHPHLRMRQWGCEALTYLTRQALQHPGYSPPLPENNRVQTQLLSPLAELCGIPYPDVRQKQLDTVQHVLHGSGEVLDHGWPLILTIVSSINASHSDILIRSAFQCLQLVFTDFLPTIPYSCYPQCVEAATKFGSQETELNVSLTAVGLLWNLSDFFFQNVASLKSKSEESSKVFPEFPGCQNMPSFDKLWMCLYYKLKDLCLDSRPAVRKSSGQTLFSTIAAHGSVLESNTWQAVLWQVLFPLLDNVIIQSDSASCEKVSQSQVIMMHHSRNTAQKQWAETKVLTISGVARVFNTKRKLLRNMEDYSKAWLLLLEYVEKMCLSETSEVSLAALKAMQEMILSSKEEQGFEMKSGSNAMNETNWRLCWKAWINIGEQKTSYIRNTSDLLSYSQILLTGFIQIYTSLLPFVKDQFREQDIDNLGKVLCSCISITTDSDMMESTNVLGPVHSAALEAMKKTREIFPNKFTNGLFQIYFKFVSNAFTVSSDRSHILEKNLFFGENVIEEVGAYFSSMSENESNLSVLPFDQILHKIVQVLGIPLNKRYQWPKQTTWRVAINVLIKILRLGLPLVRKYQSFDYTPFWMELSTVLENFLFPECLQDMEDRFTDGAIDCHVIELLREEVLPYPKIVAVEFIRRFVILLNRGSIHSSIELSDDCSGSIGLREDFAKECFETLLEFSLLKSTPEELSKMGSDVRDAGNGGDLTPTLTSKLAITSLLQRFKEVLVEAIDGEKLNRNIPLQRQKASEVAFVLKAIGTVISSLKKKDVPASVDQKTWQQVISLYPLLVQCTGTNSPQINASVKEALYEYHDMLTAPKSIK